MLWYVEYLTEILIHVMFFTTEQEKRSMTLSQNATVHLFGPEAESFDSLPTATKLQSYARIEGVYDITYYARMYENGLTYYTINEARLLPTAAAAHFMKVST